MKTRLFLAAVLVLLGGSLAGRHSFGSFQVITEPSGAVVTIAGTNIYLGTTPTPLHPVEMNHSAVWNGGVAGQVIDLHIYKDGYAPIYQRVFVPFRHQNHHQATADRNPVVFRFQLRPLPPPPSYYYPVNPCPVPYNGYFYGIDAQAAPNPPAKYRAKYSARGRRY